MRKESRQEFQVEIIETLARTFTIQASNELEAIGLVKQSYANQEVVLGAEDYLETEFIVNPLN